MAPVQKTKSPKSDNGPNIFKRFANAIFGVSPRAASSSAAVFKKPTITRVASKSTLIKGSAASSSNTKLVKKVNSVKLMFKKVSAFKGTKAKTFTASKGTGTKGLSES